MKLLSSLFIALALLAGPALASDKTDLEHSIKTDQELVAKHADFVTIDSAIATKLLKELGLDYGSTPITSVDAILSDPLVAHGNIVLAIFTTGDKQIDAQLVPFSVFEKAYEKAQGPKA